MANTWDILKKELAVLGVTLIDAKTCYDSENKAPIPIREKLKLVKKDLDNNFQLFNSLWKDLGDSLQQTQYDSSPICPRMLSVFIESVKSLNDLMSLMIENSPPCRELLMHKTKTFMALRTALNRDYMSFPREIISSVIDYKLGIDWAFRMNSRLVYLMGLLQFARSGSQAVNKVQVKTARGVAGPWANLDLPMLERAFHWDDIDEEVRGRDKDLRKQRRYKMGLENYNSDVDTDEGFYWREMRNDPYLWSDRDSESPYPGRNTLSKY